MSHPSSADPFTVAVARCVTAVERLRVDKSEAAFVEFHVCVERVPKLHEPVLERALARRRAM